MDPIGLAVIVGPNDLRMGGALSEFRLTQEALDGHRVLRELRAQHLDGGEPLFGMLRTVDRGSASLADMLDEAVTGDGATHMVFGAHWLPS